MVNPDIGYCHDHLSQKPGSNRRATPKLDQQVTTITVMPPDVLREIVKDKTSAEIIALCRVNKRFNNALCQDITFWRNRARQANLVFNDRTTLAELKRMLVKHENKPRVMKTFDLIFKPGRATASEWNQVPFFDKVDKAAAKNARVFGEVSLDDMKRILNEEYRKYYVLAENDTEDNYPHLEDLLTPEEFEAKLQQLILHDFDIIDNSLPEADISFYLVYTHDGVLSTILLEGHFEDYYMFAFPSPIIKLLKSQPQPITLKTMQGLYPDIPFNLGYVSRDRRDYEFVNEGPDQVIDGVLMRVKPFRTQDDDEDSDNENYDYFKAAYREAYLDASDSDDE